MFDLKMISPHPVYPTVDQTIIIFIPSVTWAIIIKDFIWMIWINFSWFDTGRFINNNLFLWYINADSRSFIIFNFIYSAPRMLYCTNTNKLWCNSKCYKIKNLVTRKWIFLMPQMTVTISDVFAFSDKFITIKWTILVIKSSVISKK